MKDNSVGECVAVIKDIIENIRQAEKDADASVYDATVKAREIVADAETNSEHLLDMNNAIIKKDTIKISEKASFEAEKEYVTIIKDAEKQAENLFNDEKKEKAVSYIVEKFLNTYVNSKR